jgi:hypothetical protein
VSTVSTADLEVARRYRFGPLERRGVLGGWRGGQIGSVATSLVLAIVALREDPHLVGLLLACMLVGCGGFCATWPLGGLTVEQWVPVVARWLAGGHRVHLDGAFMRGSVRMTGGRISKAETAPPASLASLSIEDAAGPGSPGMVRDRRTGSCAAVLAVSGSGFSLLDPAARDMKVASWSSLLASLAREGCPVDRIQWVARTLPDAGEGVASYFAKERKAPVDCAPSRSYEALLASESLEFVRQETFVVVRVSPRRAQAIRRAEAGRGGVMAVVDALLSEVSAVAADLGSSGVFVDGVLDAEALSHVVAEAFSPGPLAGGAPPGGAWPLSLRPAWDSIETDATVHAVYWIAEWPRVDVQADFLSPLLSSRGARVTVSVVMEPIAPSVATRRVENARVSRAADDELRRRGGFMHTARRRREEDALSTRESELADGHAHYRFSGYVGVTASNLDELALACASVEQAASRSFLCLRRIYGDQERALGFLLPLARGLQ